MLKWESIREKGFSLLERQLCALVTLAAEGPSAAGQGAGPEQQKSPGRGRFQDPRGSQLSGKSLPGSWDTPRASRDLQWLHSSAGKDVFCW